MDYLSFVLRHASQRAVREWSASVRKQGDGFLPQIASWRSSGVGFSSSGPTALANRGPYASRLRSRGIVSFSGSDVFRFLQGLVTNDVMRFAADVPAVMTPQPTRNQAAAFVPPLYTSVLNPQGRFLFDMFLYKPVNSAEKLNYSGSGSGRDDVPALVADVDATTLDELVTHLKRYRLRAQVEIENSSQELSAWQLFGGDSGNDNAVEEDIVGGGSIGWGGVRDPAGHVSAESDRMGWRWYKDPRLQVLGFRGVFPSDTVPPLVEAGKEVDEEYYLLWRLEQGVAEGCVEILKGEAIPLEYNLVGLNAINFDKGCYIGQELVARTHHLGVIRKRLMPVNFVDEDGKEVQQAVAPGSEIIDVGSGKKVGSVTTALGSRGLGLIRLEATHKSTSSLVIKYSEKVYAKVIRPKWWPPEWGHEEAKVAGV
eukprot:c25179_g1_i2 orf=110-1387(+)